MGLGDVVVTLKMHFLGRVAVKVLEIHCCNRICRFPFSFLLDPNSGGGTLLPHTRFSAVLPSADGYLILEARTSEMVSSLIICTNRSLCGKKKKNDNRSQCLHQRVEGTCE